MDFVKNKAQDEKIKKATNEIIDSIFGTKSAKLKNEFVVL